MKKENWELSEKEMTTLGQGLRSIKVAKKQKAGSQEEHWFQGKENGLDVFVTTDKRDIKWIQITFRKLFVEWKESGVSWGYINNVRESANQFPASSTLKPEPKMNFDFVEAVIGILEENDEYELLGQVAYVLEEALDKI